MLDSKKRAKLRSEANKLEPIFRLGKGEITQDMIIGISEALEKRELIKLSLLQNCELDIKECANIIKDRTRSEIVQIIGRKFVLYKKGDNKK